MKLKAYGKINLFLDVIGKRVDGYHNLKMIMQTINLWDEVDIEKTDEGIELTCDNVNLPTDKRNIAYKAAELFINTYNINSGVKIKIKKNIPIEAGLAGGSTDGAAVIKILNVIFNKNLSEEEMIGLGKKIGADVPFCIVGGTAKCEGIGEVIKPLKPLRNCILVLIKPNFGVSTKEVFNKIDNKSYIHPRIDKILKGIDEGDLTQIGSNLNNVLEQVTIEQNPVIGDIKKMIKANGSLGTLMSGSGPTVYGIFDDLHKAENCYKEAIKKYNQVFLTKTIIP
ncbi:4-(cytidine 5'-diphospho)-2-C-methyl-D-erythritol kinase [Clostridium peptidivorans]|uniref:4-(cytidine 5'-diphospho)-2-C-methyl-D-erythritol kinase n=1 Tax=Clostridium peptidivorans TaxID=100174 RepID=UPI000BE38F6B|nr:4-(cytidine 5'-diphospho)-2-C-methyl-D-erythritol kinase [Clostridium peptidivorans]